MSDGMLGQLSSSAADGRSAITSPRASGRSVRGKLIAIVLLITGIVLVASMIAVVVYDLYVYRSSWAADVAVEADIVALSAAPALAFDDRVIAERNLSTLRARPAIRAAALYSADGRLYVQYLQPDAGLAPPQILSATEGVTIRGQTVEIVRRINSDNEYIGAIYLRARYDVMARASAYLGIFGLIAVLSLVLALVLSVSLQRAISTPLEAIAEVASQIVRRGDYGLRVVKTTDDEIGVVVEALNRMLDEVQARTDAIEQAKDQLSESEKIYRAIGESIAYGVWVNDATGLNRYASDSFLRMTGMTQKECSDSGWSRALHPDDAEATMTAWQQCVRTGNNWYREHRMLGADGQYHPVLAQGVPIRGDDGAIEAWAGINLDVSRLKQTEESLLEADRRKDEFLATLAHELRNPLAPIRNATEVLRSGVATDEQKQQTREIIARQVQHMALLLDDLLDVSRISSGRLELNLECVDVAALIDAAVEIARPLLTAKRHQLEIALPDQAIHVNVDPLRFSQALSNLLTNAAKYTDAGGLIRVTASSDDQGLAISVSDNGIGLTAQAIPRVFQMFSQVEGALKRSQGGLGIGLALVKGLITLHGGTVEVVSAGLGRGSKFTLRLPAESIIAAPVSPAVSPANFTPPGAQQCKVLIADDKQDSTDTLGMLLRLLGYEVVLAYSGEQAVELALAERPDACILDIGMPQMSGYEVAQRLRQDAWGRRMLLIAVTGWGQQEDVDQAHAAGFDHHFRKPVDTDDLTGCLAAYVATIRNCETTA